MPTADEPHILYVAWGFPPCRGGGVYRALATANEFAAAGCRVTVLTATAESFERYTGTDPSLLAQLDPRIDVVRVPFVWPAREPDIRTWDLLRAAAPRVWWRLRKRLDLLPFPEYGYGPWRRPLERAALEVHRRTPVDLVVASANPNVDFTAADVLFRRHKVPYVMDYRDAWMLDVFGGGLAHPIGGRVDRWEQHLLANATEVWFVNEPIRRWHAARHPEVAQRMHVVANGFDAQFAPVPSPPRDSRDHLVFGYLGTATAKVPLQEFADGWRQARHDSPPVAGARAQLWGYLGFYATPDPDLAQLVAEYADDVVAYRGPVPKQEVAAKYAGFDVLLLILGSGRYVTSGKVFEYMASGLPIVSVHDPGNAASDVLRGYPSWFPAASLDPGDVAAALAAAAEAAQRSDLVTRQECARFAEQYRRQVQLAPRVSALRAAVGRGTERSAAAENEPEKASQQEQVAPEPAPDPRRSSPEPTSTAPLAVLLLATGAAPGFSGAATLAEHRHRLGLSPTDELQVVARRSGRIVPAALASLCSSSVRRLVRRSDIVVAVDRSAASVAWGLARLNQRADVVQGWDAGASTVRRRRGTFSS